MRPSLWLQYLAGTFLLLAPWAYLVALGPWWPYLIHAAIWWLAWLVAAALWHRNVEEE